MLIKIFLKIRYYKCCIAIELIQKKEMILLKVIDVKNVWFVTIGFSVMDSSLKIMYAMVAMVCHC